VTTSQLEHRIRLLPAVRSCSIDDSRVTVLVDASTDRRRVAADVAFILADVGMERMVHVLGGMTRADELLPREEARDSTRDPRRTALLLLAGVVAVACIALGVMMLVSDNGGAPAAPGTTTPTRPQVTTTEVTPTTPPTFPDDWQLQPQS
jgi:hypothetical protein